jgi:hypothetical protein
MKIRTISKFQICATYSNIRIYTFYLILKHLIKLIHTKKKKLVSNHFYIILYICYRDAQIYIYSKNFFSYFLVFFCPINKDHH